MHDSSGASSCGRYSVYGSTGSKQAARNARSRALGPSLRRNRDRSEVCPTEDTPSRGQIAPVRPQPVMLASEDITMEFHCLRQLDSRCTIMSRKKEKVRTAPSSTTVWGSDNSTKQTCKLSKKSRANHDGTERQKCTQPAIGDVATIGQERSW